MSRIHQRAARTCMLAVVLSGLAWLPAPAAQAGDFIAPAGWAGVLAAGKPFTVYFDYRLESAPAAAARLIFWSPGPGSSPPGERATLVGEVEVSRGKGRGYVTAWLDPRWSRPGLDGAAGVGFEFSLVLGRVQSDRFRLLLEGLPPLPPPPDSPSPDRSPPPVPAAARPAFPRRPPPAGETVEKGGGEDCLFPCPEGKESDTSLYEYLIRLRHPACPRRREPVVDPDAVPFDDLVKCPPVRDRFWQREAEESERPPAKSPPAPLPGHPPAGAPEPESRTGPCGSCP